MPLPRPAASAAPTTAADEGLLLARLRAGDEAAFADLVRQHHSSLERLARRFLRNPASAEEVVQEAWLAVVRGLNDFEGRSSLRTWIFRILVNRAKTRAVRDARQVVFSDLVRAELDEASPDDRLFADASHGGWARGHWLEPVARWHHADPEGQLLDGEIRQAIDAALAELPPTQAAVVTLRDIEGWSAAEVCNELDLSETNQRVLLHRGRSRIRQALDPFLRR